MSLPQSEPHAGSTVIAQVVEKYADDLIALRRGIESRFESELRAAVAPMISAVPATGDVEDRLLSITSDIGTVTVTGAAAIPGETVAFTRSTLAPDSSPSGTSMTR